MPSNQDIPFSQELLRKGTHTCALSIPVGYWILGLSKVEALIIMVPVSLLMVFIDIARLRDWSLWRDFFGRPAGRMIRNHEVAGDFTGATYILLSACFTIALYSKPVAIAALAFIIIGDILAALIGRKFGRHRFLGRKSFEGSAACLVGCVLVALWSPGLPFSVALLGAITATLTEALSTRIDDNVSVPIISGLVMTLYLSISSAP